MQLERFGLHDKDSHVIPHFREAPMTRIFLRHPVITMNLVRRRMRRMTMTRRTTMTTMTKIPGMIIRMIPVKMGKVS